MSSFPWWRKGGTERQCVNVRVARSWWPVLRSRPGGRATLELPGRDGRELCLRARPLGPSCLQPIRQWRPACPACRLGRVCGCECECVCVYVCVCVCVSEWGRWTELPSFIWTEDGRLHFVFSVPSSDVSWPFPNLTVTVIAEGAKGERGQGGARGGGRRTSGDLRLAHPPSVVWMGRCRGWTCFFPRTGPWETRGQEDSRARSGGGISESQKCSLHELRITVDVALLFPAQS